MRFQTLSAIAFATVVSAQYPAQTYPGAPQPTTSSPPVVGDKCAADCGAAFDKCKAQPGENNSFCVSQYAGCLGFNPFAAGAPATTACMKGSKPTYTPAPPPATYTPAPPPPAGGDKCAADCGAAFDKCKAQPGENNSFCVSQYAGCLGFNPFAAGAPATTACIKTSKPTYTPAPPPPAGGDKCAADCGAAFDKCKAQPGENNSFCVSQYAGCLGFNPFAAGAPATTACVKTTIATYPGAAPTNTPKPSAGGDKCAKECTAAFDKCKAQPGENNSFCVSQYAGCLGFNPFAAGAPAPTACVTAAGQTTAKPTGPVGTGSPATPTTKAPPLQVSNVAGVNAPAMGLLAVGLLAML